MGPDEDNKARTIPAADILAWLADPSNIGQPLIVQHAVVVGPIDLSFWVVESSISIVDSILTEHVEFSGATLRNGIRMNGSTVPSIR